MYYLAQKYFLIPQMKIFTHSKISSHRGASLVLAFLGRKVQKQTIASKSFALSSNYFPSKE